MVMDWTHANVIALIALLVSMVSAGVSVLTKMRSDEDRVKSNSLARDFARFSARAARRALYDLKRSKVFTSESSRALSDEDWDEVGRYVKRLGEHIDSLEGQLERLEDPGLLIGPTRKAKIAQRHAAELRERATNISDREWANKQRVLIQSLNSSVKGFGEFIERSGES